ncbi:MAG TPA: STAS domain-containing protein [Planctomycetota bacterium]|nr:STAS domain-containing protein [Planctomycetota bacterium]
MSTTPPAPGSNPPQRTVGPLSTARLQPKMTTTVHADNIAVVSILESRILDENNINEIGRQLMDLVVKRYMIKMVIDLGEVKYLSSAVLRQFIALYKAIKAEKGDLKLCRVNPEVREVFKITQLDKMIEIKDDLDSAINAFKKKGGWGFLQR